MIGRRREFAEIGHLLDRAAAGSGGLLVILGAAGSGRTTVADAAAGLGRTRGFDGGHFPQLAHPSRFARVLALTGRWPE